MMDAPHITTGGIAFDRTLGRLGLAAAVLLATVVVGAGSAVAAPAGAAPAMDAPNETAEGPTNTWSGGPIDGFGAPSRPIHSPVEPIGGFENAEESSDGLQMEVVEVNEEHIVIEVAVPEGVELAADGEGEVGPGASVWRLGHAARFAIHEDGEAMSLPEDTDGLATPVHTEATGGVGENRIMSFRTEDLDLSEEDEEVTLGLAVLSDGERTVPDDSWDTVSITVEPLPVESGDPDA